MTGRSASLLLFITALIWGCSFVAQDVSADLIGPFTFNFARFYIGAIVLVPFIIAGRRKRRVSKEENRNAIRGGICCGAALAAASVLQQAGMATAGAGKAGFITTLYNILVPIILLMMGRKVDKKIWIYAIMAVFGMYLLCMSGGFSLERGDLFLMLCALFFAFHVLIIDHFSPLADGIEISCVQFFTAALICTVGALLFEDIDLSLLARAALPVIYAGAFSCGIAYTLQVVGQKYVHPSLATIILSLESVVAAIAGWLILGDSLTLRQIAGCLIVFTAALLSQFAQKKT